jgi:hypothetical protein
MTALPQNLVVNGNPLFTPGWAVISAFGAMFSPP